MHPLRRLLIAALVCVTICAFSVLAEAGEPDQESAERILGPQWKSLSRRAGMVFAGTVLSAGPQTARTDRTVSAIELSFRVDRPIAGVARGQILTIHEWAGAWSRHRAMRSGEHLLLFIVSAEPLRPDESRGRIARTNCARCKRAECCRASPHHPHQGGATGARDSGCAGRVIMRSRV